VIIRRLAGSTITLALLAACAKPAPPPAAPPPPDATAIRSGIEKEMAKFGPVMTGRDPAALAAMFTPDAVWILPDGTTFTGTAAITAGAKGFFDTVESFGNPTATIDRLLVVSDSEVVTFAHGTMTLKMKGAKTEENHVNPFADYWKKAADGTWKIAYEINAEGPAKK
jgi:uncharacterized protein (TIGR02246 family)